MPCGRQLLVHVNFFAMRQLIIIIIIVIIIMKK